MAEPKSVRPAMLPPPGFVEHAVERGLAEVIAAEALRAIEEDISSDPHGTDPSNDVVPPRPRRRRDSGIIAGAMIDDTPTLPYIRVAQADD